MKLIILIFISQQPEWVYEYVNPGATEYPTAIVVDSMGNTYLTGLIHIGITQVVGIIKLDSLGNEKWLYHGDTLYGGVGNDITCMFNKIYLTGIKIDTTGNMVVTGVDTAGNELFRYIGILDSEGKAIKVSLSHHIYTAGVKYPSPSDIIVLKLDSLGNLKWQYVYDGGSYDNAVDIEVDGNENIYVAGYTTNPGTSEDFCVIKIDSSGNLKWVYTYNGPGNLNDRINDLYLDIKGNIYVIGNAAGIGTGWDICAIKIDSLGNQKWVYTYNGTNQTDWGKRILVDESLDVYITGFATIDSIYYLTVIKLDSLGNEEWVYMDKGFYEMGAWANDMCFDSLGNLYICGVCETPYGNRIYLIKMSIRGDTLWRYVYPNNIAGDDNCKRIVSDINGNVYLAGSKYISTWDDDIIVMKFKNETGVRENSEFGIRNLDLRNYKFFDITGRRIRFLNKRGVYFFKGKNKFKKTIFLKGGGL